MYVNKEIQNNTECCKHPLTLILEIKLYTLVEVVIEKLLERAVNQMYQNRIHVDNS